MYSLQCLCQHASRMQAPKAIVLSSLATAHHGGYRRIDGMLTLQLTGNRLPHMNRGPEAK